jgi:hypothetical protein
MQINKTDFDITSVEDEIRADGLCKELLMEFYHTLQESGLDPAQATLAANSADYFVRDFIVGFKRCNLFTETPGLVRQFAGNWYIVNTVEPDPEELAGHLAGVARFYLYLSELGLISVEFLKLINDECSDSLFYNSRIDSFWAITGDGYLEWEKVCSLRD